MRKTLNLIIGIIFTIISLYSFNIISYAELQIKGDGTVQSPYIIENEEQLIKLVTNEYPLSSHYKLNNDITLITKSWKPIGIDSNTVFTGVFNGNGHKITNLNVEVNSFENIGLFFKNSGTISNLTVQTGSTGIIGNKYTGIIASSNSGTINNCSVSGLIFTQNTSDKDASLGGIVGINTGTISNCESNVKIRNGNTRTGGIAGYSENTISNCKFNGSADDLDTHYFGGIVGYLKGMVTKCASSGTIDSFLDYAGGVVGYAESGTISICSNNADIKNKRNTHDSYTGGLIGFNENANIENCFSIGSIICENTTPYNTYVGGFVGSNSSGNYIKNSYCIGIVSGKTANAFSNGTSKLYENCFYNKSIQNTTESSAYGLANEQMKDVENCKTNFTFWDFNNIWEIDQTINNGYPHLRSIDIPITKISFSEESITLSVGETIKLTVSILPEGSTNKTLTFTSSDADIVSVNSNGNITAKNIGTATITAQSSNGISAECTITVIASGTESLIFKIDDISTLTGQEIIVPIRLLAGNSQGISSFEFDIKYDSEYLIPTEISNGNLFNKINQHIDSNADTINVSGASSTNIQGNGIIAYLKFNVKSDMKSTESNLMAYAKNLTFLNNGIQKNLKSITYNGIVSIKKFLPGDVDDSGNLTAADASLILQKVLDKNSTFPIDKK